MDLSAILEVAIGIIFVWIVLSLATIQIQEWITTQLDKRAKDMEASIHEMLANPDLKAQFYDHPVIRDQHHLVGGWRRPVDQPVDPRLRQFGH